ncbi:MAG: ATP-binding protein [Acidobacteriota bacterium]|nr:ATP-binding protein [Acidobacteriota bacterium]
MDWCVDTRVAGAADLIESDIADHLSRHAAEPGVVELARPILHDGLRGVEPGPVWASLDWSGRHCLLRLRPLPDGELPGDPVGDGATRAHDHSARLASGLGSNGEATVVALGVARIPQRDLDLPPSDLGRWAAGPLQAGHVLGLLSSEIWSGRSLEEAAACTGSTMAAHMAAHLGAPADGRALGEAVIEMERQLGADFELVDADQTRLVLRNRRCPFGPLTSPGMCRFTSALAGAAAARVGGHAAVSMMESLAEGDRECRMVVDLTSELDPEVAHGYRWPPPPSEEGPADDEEGQRRFQVTLSLELPRDLLSVPVTRHLIRAAMDEVGVVSDDADAVDLAVTEACANVIDHSGPGDAYDVAVTINPSAAHIRVVDVGRGFDHRSLALPEMADSEAEHGRGLALMHALVDQVRFESAPERGTVVHLVKTLRFEEDATAHRLMGRD